MKRFISLIIAVLLIMSSTLTYAQDDKKGNTRSYIEENFKKEIKKVEDLFKKFHEDEKQRNWLISQLTEMKSKLEKNDESYKNNLTIYLNGVEFKNGSSSVITYKKVNLPINLITKGLGADLRYSRNTGTLTITKTGVKIVINLYKKTISLNNIEIKPNILSNEKTNNTIQLIKYIAEVLGYKVDINESKGVVVIEGIKNSADTIHPTVPQKLTASAISTTQINLGWLPATDSSGVTGYKIFRNGTQVATLANVTTFSDTGLSAGTVYLYTISSYDAAGNNSALSPAVYATTIALAGNGNGIRGDYYDNMDFTNLKLTRIDAAIDFDWGTGSPEPSIGNDTYTVRWNGQLLPQYSETYTFYTLNDDGVRLWVNGKLIINKWNDCSATENNGKIRLNAGQKVDIRMDYYENTVNSAAKLLWSSQSQIKQIIPKSQLFSDNADTRAPSVPARLAASAISSTQVNLSWHASSDNIGIAGYKIFRNGVQIGTTLNSTLYIDTGLTAGTMYSYSVSAYDTSANNSAQSNVINVATTPLVGNGNGILGEYYDNKDFTNLKFTRVDPNIDFNWGKGSPDPSIGNDTFAIRWTGQLLPLYSEQYTFHTMSDDGVRLWMNGILFIDNWTDHGSSTNEKKIILAAGQKYDLRLEYYNNIGETAMKLSWSSASQKKQIIPQSQLFTYSVDTQAPAVPGGLIATAATASQMNLIWNASTDNYAVTGYKVFRNGTQIGTVTSGTTYNDSGLTANTTYSYSVSAYDAAGNNSAQCTAVNAVTAVP